MMTAILALEDGTVFQGQAIGARASACGEVCFNTSMTGYQEILTDPSYTRQIVTMTYPEIGNYGVNPEDVESYQPHVAGFVVRELSPVMSSWRGRQSLGGYLQDNGVPGIEGIDTRALTKKLRVRGAMNSFISTEGVSVEEAKKRAVDWPGLEGVDYVKEVTHKKAFSWEEHGVDSRAFCLPGGNGEDTSPALPAAEIPIVAYDFGVKYNILRCLRRCGFDVTVLPATTTAEEALALRHDELTGDLGALPPMKIHCAQLVEGALKSALSPNEDSPPADAESAPSLVDSLQQADRKPVGGKLRLLKKKD